MSRDAVFCMSQGGQIIKATEEVSQDAVGCANLCACARVAKSSERYRAVGRDTVGGCTHFVHPGWPDPGATKDVSRDAVDCTFPCALAGLARSSGLQRVVSRHETVPAMYTRTWRRMARSAGLKRR